MNKRTVFIISLLLALVAAGGYYQFDRTISSPEVPMVETPADGDVLLVSEPTDFVRVGNISVDAPGNRQDDMYLVYEAPGAAALAARLEIDPLSVCVAIPCIAMSATYGAAFGGKRAVVEGQALSDGVVLLRKLTIIDETQGPPAVPAAGDVFIPWPAAANLIRSCAVESAFQNHSLDVRLTLKDGRVFRAVEPVIDEVMRVARDAQAMCGDLQLATE